ncbi:MAG: tetratricopeptide repeat protein, partial [Thermodesulfobacteriota bacterium]
MILWSIPEFLLATALLWAALAGWPSGLIWGDEIRRSGPEMARCALFPAFLRSSGIHWEDGGTEAGHVLREARRAFRDGIADNDLLRAIELYREALARTDHAPWAAEALWRIAESYHRLGHLQEAVAYWRLTVNALPPGERRTEAKAALADCLFRLWRLEEAEPLLVALGKELNRAEERAWARFMLGDILLAKGRATEAVRVYQDAQAISPSAHWIPAGSLENMAALALERGDNRQATWSLMTAISLYPGHAQRQRWMYTLANLLIRQGKGPEAAILLDRLHREAPGTEEAWLAQLRLWALGRSDGERPVALAGSAPLSPWLDPSQRPPHRGQPDPMYQEALLAVIQVLSSRGQKDVALSLLTNAYRPFGTSKIPPALGQALRELTGSAVEGAVRRGECAKALEIFESVSMVFPDLEGEAPTMIGVGRCLEMGGFFETAADIFRRAGSNLGQGPYKMEALSGLLRATLGLARWDDARRVLEEIPEGVAWKRWAEMLLDWASENGDPGSGPAAARWLRDLAQGRIPAAAAVEMGRFSMSSGRDASALDLLRIALEKGEPGQDPAWAEAWVVYGDLLARLGRDKDAEAAYRRATEGQAPEDRQWAAYRIL